MAGGSITRREAVALATAGGTALLAGCSSPTTTSAGSESAAAETASLEVDASGVWMVVKGYEWGPGVSELVVELPFEVSAVEGSVTVATAGTSRDVTELFPCDEAGEKTDGPSSRLGIQMETTNAVSGSPFTYDMSTLHNLWTSEYRFVIRSSELMLDGTPYALTVTGDCAGQRICPDTEAFAKRWEVGPEDGDADGLTLQMAAFEPEDLAGAGDGSVPLVIWLHGQGEGGTDVDIALLGNEVCALAREEIQGHFSCADGAAGAYVLVPQCPTYWMDEGDGTNGAGDGISRYTNLLMQAIQAYVDDTPCIDKSRVYLGGCSNGGYMTMNMAIEYPGYFAALYPMCEAYSYLVQDGDAKGERWLTDEKVALLVDMPLWMACSIDDTVVDPGAYSLPSYQALAQKGADNAWLSVFESVRGSDDPSASYLGHWVWVYLLNDQVAGAQDAAAVASAEPEGTYGTTPTNDGGGAELPQGFGNLFDWLNAQVL